MFFPVFISRVGMFVMSILDSIILAHYNSLHLGYQSIADTPIIFIMLAINGLVQGVLFILLANILTSLSLLLRFIYIIPRYKFKNS
ncbi:MAG: hypothetical protein LBR70_01875 [Lactobacillaceae bacterium]|nr:hypothetical protein [Lactobacillaceae bacterium]